MREGMGCRLRRKAQRTQILAWSCGGAGLSSGQSNSLNWQREVRVLTGGQREGPPYTKVTPERNSTWQTWVLPWLLWSFMLVCLVQQQKLSGEGDPKLKSYRERNLDQFYPAGAGGTR